MTRAPCPAASAVMVVSSRVLPNPEPPQRTRTEPCPSPALVSAWVSTSSSAARPTRTGHSTLTTKRFWHASMLVEARPPSPVPSARRPPLRADVPDGRRQHGEHEEGEEQTTRNGQEPAGCPPRPHGHDLHDDRAHHGAAEHAVHDCPRRDLLAVGQVPTFETQCPQAVVG